MKYIKILCIVILANYASFALAKVNSEPLEIWLYPLYTEEIVRNMTKPFIRYLESETDQAYFVTISTDMPKLQDRCRNGAPHIIIASMVLTETIETLCNYKKLAITFQDIMLFTQKTSIDKTLEKIKRVGLIRHVKATQIAKNELPEVNSDYVSIIYPNIFALMRNYKKDNIDAFALPLGTTKAAPLFYNKWEPIHTFREKGGAAVIVSPSIDKNIEERLTEVLLRNDLITRQLWQSEFGLGPFIDPSSQH